MAYAVAAVEQAARVVQVLLSSRRPGAHRPLPDMPVRGTGPLKLKVSEAALYRWEDVANLRLERIQRAEQVPVLVEDDSVLFYGVPIRDRYADFEVVVARTGEPTPMRTRRVVDTCPMVNRSLSQERILEEDRVYYVASPTPDPFYWTMASAGSAAVLPLDLPGPTSERARMRLFLASPSGIDPSSHPLRVSLNGTALQQSGFVDEGNTGLDFPVPAGVLLEENELLVEVDEAQEHALFFIDRIWVRYHRRLAAGPDGIRFTAAPGACLQIGGFTGQEVYLLDVTVPEAPIHLTGHRLVPDSAGGTTLRFRENRPPSPIGDAFSYLAVPASAVRTPAPLGTLRAVNFTSSKYGAAHLVITHPEFLQAAQELARHHARQGLKSMVVTTEQVFDTFSGGRPSPYAIRELFRTAREYWTVKPDYLLLMGASTVDSNGHLGGGEIDFVPTPFRVIAEHGFEAASDGWYVATGESVAPQAAIGRLAVRSTREAARVVQKLVRWQARPPVPTRRLLFASDRAAAEGPPFTIRAENLIHSCVPESLAGMRFQVEASTSPTVELIEHLDNGVDALIFHGHAYLEGWSSPPIFTVDHAQGLENDRCFLLLSWSCFDGAFVGPWGESLAWAFVQNPDGGAIAAIAGSTLTENAAVDLLAREVLCRLTRGRAATVGDALRAAKSALLGFQVEIDDVIGTFNLLGDPATPNPWMDLAD